MIIDEQLTSHVARLRADRHNDVHIVAEPARDRRGQCGVPRIQRHGVLTGEGESGVGDQGDRVGDERSSGPPRSEAAWRRATSASAADGEYAASTRRVA
jgi:hypothetical protein